MALAAMLVSDRQDWCTPRDFFDRLDAEFSFTIDACASDANALLPRYWTIRENALWQSWKGERVFCNPPYGPHQRDFIRKAATAGAELVVLLIPARVDTAIWHDLIFPNAEVRFVRGRLKFSGASNAAPFPSAVVIFRSAD